jgi:hypothetical protein
LLTGVQGLLRSIIIGPSGVTAMSQPTAPQEKKSLQHYKLARQLIANMRVENLWLCFLFKMILAEIKIKRCL